MSGQRIPVCPATVKSERRTNDMKGQECAKNTLQTGKPKEEYPQPMAGDAEWDPKERMVDKLTAEKRALQGAIIGSAASQSSGLKNTTRTREMESVVANLEKSVDELSLTVNILRDRLAPVLMHDNVDAGLKTGPTACQSDMAKWIEGRAESVQRSIDVLRGVMDRLAL